MIKLEAGVGKGLVNNLHDVALIQAALKLIRGNDGYYFSGKITSKPNVELFDGLEKFYLDHLGTSLTNDVGKTAAGVDAKQIGQLKPNSPFLATINQKMPSSMRSIAAIRHSAVLYLRDLTQIAKTSPYLGFPFPVSIGEPLTKALAILFKGYGNRLDKSQHIFATFSGFDVTAAGKYKVLISFPAIKFLDPGTAKPRSGIPKEFARIIKADLRQKDWKVGQLETKNGITGISTTSVKSAPFKGTALILPKFVKAVSITNFKSITIADIKLMSPDNVVRKMIAVSLVHMFDIPNRLPEKDIRDIMEVLNSFASVYAADYGKVLQNYGKVLQKILEGPQTVAGCGSKKNDVPDHPFGFDFLPACENHDRRYTYLNWTKKEADDAFLEELLDACPSWVTTIINPTLRSANRSFCQRVAYLYWSAVDQLGNDAFVEAQEQAQKYGWIDKNKPYNPEVHGRYLGQLPLIERQESTTEAALRYGKRFLEEVGLISATEQDSTNIQPDLLFADKLLKAAGGNGLSILDKIFGKDNPDK